MTSSSPATDTASSGQPIFLGMSNSISGGAEGNIYGGAMSSSSGSTTTGRPPQIGRNSIVGPGFNNLDFRVSRNVPIHESIYLQFIAEAFNLANHQIITGRTERLLVVPDDLATKSGAYTCSSLAPPSGSTAGGCITPTTNTGLNAFYTPPAAPAAATCTPHGNCRVSAKLFF